MIDLSSVNSMIILKVIYFIVYQDGVPVMASASTMGHIAVWDLEKKRLHSEIRDAHKGCVSGLKFLPKEPLLITSSNDNSIKVRFAKDY